MAPDQEPKPPRKLLVLDINGLLLETAYKSDGRKYVRKQDGTMNRFFVYDRPHSKEFVEFCLEHFVVGIWSSARKHNLIPLARRIFGDRLKEVAFVWDQQYCTDTGLKHPLNVYKPVFFKELARIWKGGEKEGDLDLPAGVYNEQNTLLLDDSVYKALRNPPHCGIFPPSYNPDQGDDHLAGGGSIRSYLEQVLAAPSVPDFVKQHPYPFCGSLVLKGDEWGPSLPDEALSATILKVVTAQASLASEGIGADREVKGIKSTEAVKAIKKGNRKKARVGEGLQSSDESEKRQSPERRPSESKRIHDEMVCSGVTSRLAKNVEEAQQSHEQGWVSHMLRDRQVHRDASDAWADSYSREPSRPGRTFPRQESRPTERHTWQQDSHGYHQTGLAVRVSGYPQPEGLRSNWEVAQSSSQGPYWGQQPSSAAGPADQYDRRTVHMQPRMPGWQQPPGSYQPPGYNDTPWRGLQPLQSWDLPPGFGPPGFNAGYHEPRLEAPPWQGGPSRVHPGPRRSYYHQQEQWDGWDDRRGSNEGWPSRPEPSYYVRS